MHAYCSVCEETVALMTDDPEILELTVAMDRLDSVELVPDAIVNTKVRLTKKCANCEEELCDAILEQHAYVDMDESCTCVGDDRKLDVIASDDAELVESDNNKRIGFSLDAVICCNGCAMTLDIRLGNTMMANDMRRLM